MKTTRKMPSFQGVGAGQVATLELPIGLTYHALLFELGGTFTTSLIDKISFDFNGRPVWELTGDELDDVNTYVNGAPYNGTDRQIYLSFDRIGQRLKEMSEMTAIGTGMPYDGDPKSATYNPTPLVSIVCKIEINAAAVNPTIEAYAIQSGPRSLGAFIKRRKYYRTISGAGRLEVSDLPKGDPIDKIWIYAPGGNLDKVTLDRDNYRAFERTVTQNDFVQTYHARRTPVTNLYVIDPAETGNGMDMINSAVYDFRLGLETSGAENFTIIVDYLGDLSGN
jgi:hypothetical protein